MNVITSAIVFGRAFRPRNYWFSKHISISNTHTTTVVYIFPDSLDFDVKKENREI